jgi:hypothetical protein
MAIFVAVTDERVLMEMHGGGDETADSAASPKLGLNAGNW